MRLPVLFWEGKAILDSTRIIEHLEAVQPDPALYPEDLDERRRALELESFFDEEVGPHIRSVIVNELFMTGSEATADTFGIGQPQATRWLLRAAFPIFRPFYEYRHDISPRTIALGIEKIALAIHRLEAEIGPSGYLVGDHFSVADLTAASLLYPLAQPSEYPFTFPQAASKAIGTVLARFDGTPAQEWVRKMYHRHRGTSHAVSG